MKKWVAIFLAVCISGCTIYVRPLPKHSKAKARTYSKARVKAKTGHRPVATGVTTTVDAEWIESYKRLEKEYEHTIPDDEEIKAVGHKFSVPRSVVDHFNDMSRTEPSPQP